jgi:chemotaxis protein MotB
MRNYRRRSAARAHTGSQDFWLSFSDLMSVLVLVFILVLFYILYKYFVISDAYQEKLDEMLVVEAALNDRETELTAAQESLALQQTELDSAQAGLTEAQEELARQQLMLSLAQQAVDDSEAVLASKEAELEEALALLGERESAVTALEGELAAKQDQIDDQQAQLEALVGVRARIIQLLSEALKNNSINAKVDPASGAIMLESDVLFEYASSELTETGKQYIDSFLPVYLDVLFAEGNQEYISEIIIEGHTDTTDTYIKNLKLSQNRAYAVAEYVLDGGNSSLSASQKTQLKELLTANGRSYSDPILDENGRVDAAQSRRVVIKFRLTDEQMIQQMQDILEPDQ